MVTVDNASVIRVATALVAVKTWPGNRHRLVALESSGDVLTLRGDARSGVGVSGRLETDGEELPRTVVSADMLLKIAKSVPKASRLSLVVGEKGLEVTADGAAHTLPLYADTDVAPEIVREWTESALLSREQFREVAALSVAAAPSDSDVTEQFTGVRLEVDGGTLTAVGTDRYVLAARDVFDVGVSDSAAVVPSTWLGKLPRLLSGYVTYSVAEGAVSFDDGEIRVTLGTIGGAYLKWRPLFPPGSPLAAVSVGVGTLRDSLKKVTVLTKKDEHRPILLTSLDDAVAVSCETVDGALSTVGVAGAGDTVGSACTALNPWYLERLLSLWGRTDNVRMSWQTVRKPVELRVTGSTLRAIIMTIGHDKNYVK